MRENDEFGHYVPLVRRVIILVAVITAVPVVLWTITAFVRAYVAPAKMPTFHQLAATASINAPATNAGSDLPSPQPAERQVLARATATDAREDGGTSGQPAGMPALPAPGATTGSLPRAASAPRIPDPAMTVSAPPKAAELPSFPLPVPDSTASNNAMVAAQQPAVAMEPADSMPAAAQLSGPIPLPRHRPRDIGTVRLADMAPSSVPIPRPRPDAAGAPASAETTSGGPLDFLNNLFGGN